MYGSNDQNGDEHQVWVHIHVLEEVVKIFGQFGLTIISDNVTRERGNRTYKGSDKSTIGGEQWGKGRRNKREISRKRSDRPMIERTKGKREKNKEQRESELSGPPPPAQRQNDTELVHISARIGSQALERTHSCGSFRPCPRDVFRRRISRLSRIRRFCWSPPLFLSLKVERIVGFSQLMEPFLHRRACFDMPEMFSSDLEDATSARCWPILVRKFTRVWPTYLASSLQLHV